MPALPSLCVFPLAIGIPVPTVPPAAWQADHDYTVVGTLVINGTRIYTLTVAGHSALSGGPTGTGTGITDNTCTWDYVSDIPSIPAIPALVLPLPPCALDEF